jgi:hypothetical protein
MAKTLSITKRSLIGKANSTIVIATATAAFVVIFSLVASKALMGQASYQNRVISAKKKALTQLRSDLSARDSLVSSYNAFVGAQQNVLGGSSQGTGPLDGDNAKLVLDALPSKYDFPQVTSSVEQLVTSQQMQFQGMNGLDDEIKQQANNTSPSPKPAAMPFQVQVNGSYQSMQNLIGVFERSIRPIQIQRLQFSGDQTSMSSTIDAQTYYQPETSLSIKTEVVK